MKLPAIHVDDRRAIFVHIGAAQPEEPLWPGRRDTSGHRLWKMINEAIGWSHDEFLCRTIRYNIRENPKQTDKATLIERAQALKAIIGGRRHVIVGKVANTLMDGPEWALEWDGNALFIPDPAGMSIAYNHPETGVETRETVKTLLAELLQ